MTKIHIKEHMSGLETGKNSGLCCQKSEDEVDALELEMFRGLLFASGDA